MNLSEETVRQVALLARLGLEDAEIKKMEKDLSQVLDLFQQLEKYQASGSPTSLPHARYSARTDQSVACDENTKKMITENFPVTQDTFLKVRSVF